MSRRLAAVFLLFAACLLAAAPLRAQDVAGSADHPMLTRYPGSVIRWQDVQNYIPYRLAVGPVSGYRAIGDWIDTRGRVTRTYYELAGDRTHGDVYHNYRKALEDAGFGILAEGYFPQSSQADGIGSRKWLGIQFAENALPSSAGVELLAGSATSGGSGFVAGRRERAAGTAFVAVTVTQQRADRVLAMIDVIEVDDVETDLIVVDAEAIGKGIGEHGRVVLDGLFFDVDKATLTAESKPALDEIAKFLKDSDLAFYVVGHTDSTGSLDYNRTLSQARATAVAEALVSGYGIARERLDPHGVGPLNPVFANASDAGRDRNRRVELVER